MKIFFYSVLISIVIVLFDSYLQQIIGYNLLGYPKNGTLQRDSLIYLTSFFGEEKKLGSYIVRFLPLILSLLLFYKPKKPFYVEFLILIITGIIIFLTSERTALFLLFVNYFFYFLISNRKIFFLITVLISFIILFNYNSNSRLADKYINFTLNQTGLINILKNDNYKKHEAFEKNRLIRYYSEEHENLTLQDLKFSKIIIFLVQELKLFITNVKI